MPSELRVMSFNIRYGTADDGQNDWSLRRDLAVRAIHRFGPDLLGTQEAVDFQIEYLRKQLDDYTFVGVPRDEQQRGEYVGIFFRSRRFALLETGHFWLSETPQVAGSKSWDSRFPRMVTWCELHDRWQTPRQGSSDGPGRENSPPASLIFLNTHFDMRGIVAREESAKLLRRHIESVGGNRAIVLTGDFNCSEDDAPYRTLLSGTNEPGSCANLIDAYRSVHPFRRGDELTRHEFLAKCEGMRIDWIIHSGHYKSLEATIDRENDAGRYPSDHFPVTAVLRPV